MMAPRGPGLLLAAVMAVVLGILVSAPASAAPPPFDPGGVMCFETLESSAQCDGDAAPGATADLRLTFCVGWNADCTVRDTEPDTSSLANMVMFTPSDWSVPKGDTLPIGAIAGRIDGESWLGLLNNPCNNRVHTSFTLMNASINTSDTIAPRPEGEIDVMQPLAMDANGNGIPDGADRYPSFLAEFYSIGDTPIQPRARLFGISNIQGGWVAQNILFFEPGQTLEVGQTTVTFTPSLGIPAVAVLQDPTTPGAVAATTDFCAPTFMDLVVLGKTMNNPCTPVSVGGANCPVTTDEAPEIKELGYPSMPCDPRSRFDDDGDGMINDGCPQVAFTAETGAECDNDVSDDPEDSSINDGCPPVGFVSEGSRIPGGCSGGDEGGCTNRANPGAGGEYTFTVLAMSGRDADGDGIENGLDVCFDKANPEWNPQGVDLVNDPDMDGLPSVCDPHPSEAAPGSPNGCQAGYTGPDEDQDCYSNRADNCPLDIQLENPAQPPDPSTNKPLQTDSDGDRIGDACDPDLNAVNGDFIGYCLKFPLDVGGAGGPVVGIRDPVSAPDCVARIIEPTPCANCLPATYLVCSVNTPARLVTPSTELATFTSDVTVYATLITVVPIFGLSLPPVNPIAFSDESGFGTVDPSTAVTGADGSASTTYRLPAGLTGQAVATVTATTAGGKTCSVSFIIKPGLTVFPPTGGDPDNGTAGVLAMAAGGVITIGGVVVLAFGRRRRA